MRRYIFLSISSAIFLFLAGEKLYSQTTKIEFDKIVHDFGDIMLNSGHHSCKFTFKNTSHQPVIIQTVISSCGCTNPVWTKSPVLPGKTGTIDVTFLNDQGPYPFDKSITVYISGERKPFSLRIKGVVHDRPKTLKELFPEQFGDLSLRRGVIDLGNIAQGEAKSETTEIANTSGKDVNISFTNLSQGLKIVANPSSIPPGKKSQLTITLNTASAKRWGNNEYNATFVINGTAHHKRELKVRANIRDNFSTLTKEQVESAPLPMAASSSFDFGKVKAGTLVNTTFTVRNLGRRDLILHKIESEESRVSFKYPSKIEPGKTGKVEISLNTTDDSGDKGVIVSVITNSPSRPVFNFIITGQISK